MPHDRFYFDGKSGEITTQSIITVDKDEQGNEVLKEDLMKIEEVKDELS